MRSEFKSLTDAARKRSLAEQSTPLTEALTDAFDAGVEAGLLVAGMSLTDTFLKDLSSGAPLLEIHAKWSKEHALLADKYGPVDAAPEWEWGTHTPPSINIVLRASEALARRAVEESNFTLRLYRRHPGEPWQRQE